MRGSTRGGWLAGAVGVVVAGACGGAFAAEDLTQWSDSVKVMINTSVSGSNTGSNVQKFPLLVRLNPGTFNGFANTKPGGADIRFKCKKAVLGVPGGRHVQTSFEIQRWIDGTNDNDTAEVWVKVDDVKPSDSTQYVIMYYGNSTAVDSSNSAAVFDSASGFQGVWHLEETAAGTGTTGVYKDATKFAATGTDFVNGEPVNGVAGRGIVLNGTSDYVDIVGFTDDSLPLGTTVSAWIKSGVQTVTCNIIAKDADGNLNNGGFGLRHIYDHSWQFFEASFKPTDRIWGAGQTFTNFNGNYVAGTNGNFTPDRWYYVTGSYRGTTVDISIRSVENDSGSSNLDAGSFNHSGAVQGTLEHLLFGKQSGTVFFKGQLDEVRVARTGQMLSGAFGRLSFETQKPNATCVTIVPFSTTGTTNPRAAFRATVAAQKLRVLNTCTVSPRSLQATALYDITGRQLRATEKPAQSVLIAKGAVIR